LTIFIAAYLIFGAVFGLASFSHRHLFSEGPKKIDNSTEGITFISRAIWALICTFLWPVLMLTGVYSLWILSKRKSAERADSHES